MHEYHRINSVAYAMEANREAMRHHRVPRATGIVRAMEVYDNLTELKRKRKIENVTEVGIGLYGTDPYCVYTPWAVIAALHQDPHYHYTAIEREPGAITLLSEPPFLSDTDALRRPCERDMFARMAQWLGCSIYRAGNYSFLDVQGLTQDERVTCINADAVVGLNQLEPSSQDLILLRWVLHLMCPEAVEMVFHSAYRALSVGGTIATHADYAPQMEELGLDVSCVGEWTLGTKVR